MSEDETIVQLKAKVTALSMLVEALLATDLTRDDDPVAVGRLMTEDLFRKEASAAGKSEEARQYAMRVTETVASIVDRAVRRAVIQRSKRPD